MTERLFSRPDGVSRSFPLRIGERLRHVPQTLRRSAVVFGTKLVDLAKSAPSIPVSIPGASLLEHIATRATDPEIERMLKQAGQVWALDASIAVADSIEPESFFPEDLREALKDEGRFYTQLPLGLTVDVFDKTMLIRDTSN